LAVISVNQPATLIPALCFSTVTLSRCYESTMLKLWLFLVFPLTLLRYSQPLQSINILFF